ncbi:MAG: YdiU family protein [Ideonella sp.]|nr:YdiU family protein [Ideonella sp.]
MTTLALDTPPITSGSRAAPPAERWTNRFADLGAAFFTELNPASLPSPSWGAISPTCAADLGWDADWLRDEATQALQVLSGNALWPGMRPLASVYSGHQFGQWAGQLGDGRALLLGELSTPHGGQEIQLKGAGLTPYSRMGDGRAVLRSTIREFLCSEAMHALGIPTTRALCFTASPQSVRRETMETAAVVTRVAPSFIRFGHFEHFSHHGHAAQLEGLLGFVIQHFYPECADAPQPALALLEAVSRRTARLLAQWQAVGFCHGVMNTDNMSILGLTIDYGPFGFLDAFDPQHICNHSDHQGRYAFARQPSVAFWNLHALAQALMPVAGGDVDALRTALEPYKTEFADAMTQALRDKLGLATARPDDSALADDLLRLLATDRVDYTIAMRALAGFSTASDADNSAVRDHFIDRLGFDAWAARYRLRLQSEGSVDGERAARMNRVNPKFVLRTHLAETAIRQAQAGDFGEVERLLKVLLRPFDEQPEAAPYAALPPDWARQLEVSCSS